MAKEVRVRLALSTAAALVAVGLIAVCSAGEQPLGLGEPETILLARWGSGPGELGKKDGSEGASLGPMSFAFGPDGRLFVLDQVHGRVAVFRPDSDDRHPRQAVANRGHAYVFDRFISIPGTTFDELEVGEDGRILLLDRLVKEALVILDPRTMQVDELSVVGAGIPEGGGITAMLVRNDGIWLEYSREHSVRVLDSRWLPAERRMVTGRPARGFGGTLEASLGVSGGADVRVEHGGDGARSFFVQDDVPVGRLIELADAPGGRVLLVYHCWRWAQDGDGLAFQEVRGRWYGPDGKPAAVFSSQRTITAWEQFREFRILPDGTAVQMSFSAEGVTLLQWGAP
jgi:hypothetical protein